MSFVKSMKAKDIIEALKLVRLEPEGGYFNETIRSGLKIDARLISQKYEGQRSMFTAIYYMLTDEDESLPHRIISDEIWFFHFGDPIAMTISSPDGENTEQIIIGNDIFAGHRPQFHIPAEYTQQAKIIRKKYGFALVSTVVIPGFEYDDFELINQTDKIGGKN